MLREALWFRRDGVVLAIACISLSRAHRRHSRFTNLYAQFRSSPIRRYAWFLSPKLHARVFSTLSSGLWRKRLCPQIGFDPSRFAPSGRQQSKMTGKTWTL